MVLLTAALRSRIPCIPKFQASAILKSRQIKLDREKLGLPVFNGGLGENPLPVAPSLKQAVKQYSGIKEYTDVTGVKPFREAIHKLHFPENVSVSDLRMIVGNGSKPLLYLAQLAFAKLSEHISNAEVGKNENNFLFIHLLPAWTTYTEQLRIILDPKYISSTDGIASPNYLAIEPEFSSEESEENSIMSWPKISPIQFQNQLQKHLQEYSSFIGKSPNMLVLFNNPNNPTGCIYNERELREFSKIFRNYGIVCLADDIYSGLVHESYCEKLEHFGGSIAQYYPEGTIQSNSLSKSWGCGGYRLGWLIFPPLKSLKPNDSLGTLINGLYELSTILASSLYSFPSPHLQYAATDALNMTGSSLVPVKDVYLKKSNYVMNDITSQLLLQRNMFENIANYCRESFDDMGLKYSDSKAAWYFLLDFEPKYGNKLKARGIQTSKKLAHSLVEEIGFISVSAEHFGIRSDRKNFILRYSYVEIKEISVGNISTKENYDLSKIKQGLEVLKKWLDSL